MPNAAKGTSLLNALRQRELERITAVYGRRTNGSRYTYFDPAARLGYQERERKVLALLAAAGVGSLDGSRILEVGCGGGFWLREFVKWGARPENICGVDLLAERIAQARRVCPPGIRLECGSATHLNFVPADFDLVLQSTMFSSILDQKMRVDIAREMLRVLRPAGLILWYDFRVNNPQNSDVRGIGRQELRELFPDCQIDFHTLTLAPPIARLVGRISPALYQMLSCIRPLRTHYLALIRRHENHNERPIMRSPHHES